MAIARRWPAPRGGRVGERRCANTASALDLAGREPHRRHDGSPAVAVAAPGEIVSDRSSRPRRPDQRPPRPEKTTANCPYGSEVIAAPGRQPGPRRPAAAAQGLAGRGADQAQSRKTRRVLRAGKDDRHRVVYVAARAASESEKITGPQAANWPPRRSPRRICRHRRQRHPPVPVAPRGGSCHPLQPNDKTDPHSTTACSHRQFSRWRRHLVPGVRRLPGQRGQEWSREVVAKGVEGDVVEPPVVDLDGDDRRRGPRPGPRGR